VSGAGSVADTVAFWWSSEFPTSQAAVEWQYQPPSAQKINHVVDVAAPAPPDAPGMRRAMLTANGIPLLLAAISAESVRSDLSTTVSRTATDLIHRWKAQGERSQILRFVQPSLIGLIDGTISTLAPIFATAFLAGSHAALLVGLAASLGAAISMGLSEALSDDGELSGRGSSLVRGALTGMATFVGGTFHALPFLINDTQTALKVAYVVVALELIAIAWVRRRFLQVPLHRSLVQVTMGGCVVAGIGALIGHA
jgi:erythrin-vacuolar iron transport family protein